MDKDKNITPANYIVNNDCEQIHIPGTIQPHGVLLVLQKPDLRILQASNNTLDFFGIALPDLINQNLELIFDSSQIKQLQKVISEPHPEIFNPLKLFAKKQGVSSAFDGVIHRHQGVLILELEPASNLAHYSELDFYHLVKASIDKIKKAATFREATEVIVKEVRKVTGFDRVMIYRFEPDESGVVIAEDKQAGLSPYLDLHYPAFDIPKHARKLYYENWLRLISDINYQPVEIIPRNIPLDLTFSLLRSVSPCHIEYCRNMGISASASISLINDNSLWGLIACHHYEPRYVDYKTRKYCELLGQMLSLYIVKKQEKQAEDYRKKIAFIKRRLTEKISGNAQALKNILQSNSSNLINLVEAKGVAIYLEKDLTIVGDTPPKEAIYALVNQLLSFRRQEVFFTNSLPQVYPLAKEFKELASGVLAISIFLNQTSYHILWFRPEVVQTVCWGGNPDKLESVDDRGIVQLSPRQSFDLWKETVKEKSLPWQQVEIDAALELRNTLMLALLEFSQSALLEAAERAEVANRAKSQFLAKMSHELRTPLNAILGFTQIMMRENNLSNEQQKNIGIINRSGEHLLSLINDVLEMSKIEAGKLTLNEHGFDLYRLLDSIQEMLELKAAVQKLKLIFHRTAEVPQYVITDESKLRQVLINLLENAIKFTTAGSVTLRVSLDLQQRTTDNEELTIQFEVEDTGQGIAPHELGTLFDPFVQTETGRRSMQGTGLGLPISRQFVRLMGGDITVSSIVGRGSIFTFNIQVHLALETDVEIISNAKRVIGLEPNQPNYRILVVEDVEENCLLLVKLLETVGFQVRSANNGQEAIDLWKQWKPHLIWMDMLMPVMDGYQATKTIKALPNGRNTVIIALTANAFSEERSAVLEAGCDDFMPKPFREEIFFDKMVTHLGVRFIYKEDNQLTRPQPKPLSEQLIKDDLNVMPREWVDRLYWCARAIDDASVMELMKQIPSSESNLIAALTNLVDNFRLDIIYELAQKNLEDRA